MFRSRHRLRRLHRLHRLHRLDHLGAFADDVGGFRRPGGLFTSSRRRKAGPARILLAGLAALVFARLFTAANRSGRSSAEKLILGLGLAALGAFLLSLRRSAPRYRW